eukprot:CAMPEP_0197540580 /NCGR_PEP_ID=MMETSP1318-20131121/66417_1 /TAXON_ID=552666 /ORGANISM="Partenskyella glossopodia, Strain RCC365" /LENGTH=144 /DNA_ID=CAMNT_0043099627 /DNA_START=72 /DNA_END=506 /DNA_ORIENTATION=-
MNWTVPTPMKRGQPLGSDVVEIHHPDLEPLMAFPLGITEVLYTLTDKRIGRYAGVKPPPVCQFFVTVDDLEKPKYVGFSEVETCEDEDIGVALHETCGGFHITPTKDPNNFRVNVATQVEPVLNNCCNNRVCKPYKDSLISICQ